MTKPKPKIEVLQVPDHLTHAGKVVEEIARREAEKLKELRKILSDAEMIHSFDDKFWGATTSEMRELIRESLLQLVTGRNYGSHSGKVIERCGLMRAEKLTQKGQNYFFEIFKN